MHRAIRNNDEVPKIPSRQILADNLDRILEKTGESNNQLSARAKIAQSHIGRMRRQESAATVDMLDALASALGMEPWELLTDSETTRRSAMERMLGLETAHIRQAAKTPKVAVHRRRKAG